MDLVLEQYRTRLHTVKRVAPATLMAFDKAARRYQRHLDALGRNAKVMNSWDIEEYLAGLDLAPTTKRTEWIHLGGAYRYAFRRGMLPTDPTLDVFLPRLEDKEPQIIPNEELRGMKRRIQGDRSWLIFHLLAYTGMRQGEIRALVEEDVQLADGLISVRKAKGDKRRRVPVHPVLADVLAESLRGEPDRYVVTTRGRSPLAYDTWMDDLRRFAGDYTAHWFRRTVTQSLLDNEVEPHVTKWVLGWKPQDVMGKFYSQASVNLMQRAILKLYANDPI